MYTHRDFRAGDRVEIGQEAGELSGRSGHVVRVTEQKLHIRLDDARCIQCVSPDQIRRLTTVSAAARPL